MSYHANWMARRYKSLNKNQQCFRKHFQKRRNLTLFN